MRPWLLLSVFVTYCVSPLTSTPVPTSVPTQTPTAPTLVPTTSPTPAPTRTLYTPQRSLGVIYDGFCNSDRIWASNANMGYWDGPNCENMCFNSSSGCNSFVLEGASSPYICILSWIIGPIWPSVFHQDVTCYYNATALSYQSTFNAPTSAPTPAPTTPAPTPVPTPFTHAGYTRVDDYACAGNYSLHVNYTMIEPISCYHECWVPMRMARCNAFSVTPVSGGVRCDWYFYPNGTVSISSAPQVICYHNNTLHYAP